MVADIKTICEILGGRYIFARYEAPLKTKEYEFLDIAYIEQELAGVSDIKKEISVKFKLHKVDIELRRGYITLDLIGKCLECIDGVVLTEEEKKRLKDLGYNINILDEITA